MPLRKLLADADIQCERDGDWYRVTILTKQPALVQALSLLQVLSQAASEMVRQVRQTDSEERSAALVEQVHRERMALVQMYWALRRRGTKHRAAIAQVTASPLAQGMRYGKEEVSWAVRTIPPQPLEVTHASESASGDDGQVPARGHRPEAVPEPSV
jgi:hypothetical protein